MGYFADVSRTYLCGDGRPNPAQLEAYKLAYDFSYESMDLFKPGMNFQEIAEKCPPLPHEYLDQRYGAIAHGVGMSDEWPSIYYPQDMALVYDGELAPGMTLSVESYVGEVGGREGVKLEQQILVTETGHELLAKYPFEEALLGRQV